MYVCVHVCVYVCNMLHMVGTHSPSVSSGSGVFSLPEEGKPIERVGKGTIEILCHTEEGEQSLNTDHICTYALEETNNGFTTK